MLTHLFNTKHRRRRGVGALLCVIALVVFILLLMLVLNYTYLVYAQLRTSDVTDTLARTVLPELLDEDQLSGTPTLNQSDDKIAVETTTETFNNISNDNSPANQQLRYVIGSNNPNLTDLYLTFGHVDDVTAPITAGGANPNFDETPPLGTPLNAVRIESLRTKTGGNALYLFIRGLQAPESIELETASYAVLDSRLIGFQPTATVNTPIVPIALAASAWPVRANDVDSSGREDFEGSMTAADGSGTPGTVLLVNFRDNMAADPSEVDDQVYDGTSPSQIDINDADPNTPTDFLGPVVPGVESRTLPALALTPAGPQADDIVDALNDVATSDEPRRIFPLYGSFNGGNNSADIVGFISARVVEASLDNANLPDETLSIVLEPEFIVHFTATTARKFQIVNDVPENVYIHKIRLAR